MVNCAKKPTQIFKSLFALDRKSILAYFSEVGQLWPNIEFSASDLTRKESK